MFVKKVYIIMVFFNFKPVFLSSIILFSLLANYPFIDQFFNFMRILVSVFCISFESFRENIQASYFQKDPICNLISCPFKVLYKLLFVMTLRLAEQKESLTGAFQTFQT